MPYAATASELADFHQRLVGTWTDKRIKSGQPGSGKIHPVPFQRDANAAGVCATR